MNWMSDVQKGLAWALILVFAILVLLFTIFSAIGHLPDSNLDVFKQVVTALINIVMVVVGFFFGSSQGEKHKDEARSDALVALASNTPNGGSFGAVVAAAEKAAPAAAEKAAPPAAEVAAPPAAEAAVAEVLARQAHDQNPYTTQVPTP
jgi:predicted permease